MYQMYGSANDPQFGPKMIAERKRYPYWIANDPDQKINSLLDAMRVPGGGGYSLIRA